MNNQNVEIEHGRQKTIIIFALYLGTMIIMFLGVFFGAYSVLNNIKLQVLHTSIHGIVFGLLVAYLGLKNFFLVTNFKVEFYKSNSKFSWSNFKKEKRKRRLV